MDTRRCDVLKVVLMRGLSRREALGRLIAGAASVAFLVGAGLGQSRAAARQATPATEAPRVSGTGGLQITLQAAPVSGQQVGDETLHAARNVLARRLRGVGITHALVLQVHGHDTIVAQIPVTDDPLRVISMLQTTGLFEIIDPHGQHLAPGTVVSTTLCDSSGASPIFTTIVSSMDLRDIYVVTGDTGTNPGVGFELQGDAARRLFQYTRGHLGQPLAIVIDKVVVSSPTIEGAISTQGIIEGIPPQLVMYEVAALRSGPLPVPLQVVQSRVIARIGVPVDDQDPIP